MYPQHGAGCGLSFEQISAISAIVAKRSKAKATLDYARAEEIFNTISREYSVNIDNRAGEWALIYKKYVFNPDTHQK